MRHPAAALGVDVGLVLVFAAVGRASHAETSPLAGVLQTAWPFLVGTVCGWAVVRVRRGSWPLAVGPGVTVWFATLVIGMVLRRAVGAGTAVAFVAVAAVVLAALLLGWRALAARRSRTAGRQRY